METNINHYRGVKVKFLRATNCRGSRIKLTDEWLNQSKTIEYKHTRDDTFDQAIDYLMKNGFKIKGYSEMKNEYIVFCDNWGGIFFTFIK